MSDATTPAPLTVLYASGRAERSEGLVSRLAGEGYSLVMADDGEEAIALLKARRPQLLIADWDLPGGGGLQVLRRARSAGSNSAVPVLLTCEAPDWRSKLRQAIDNGADDCMARPLDLELVVLRIRALRRIAAVQSRLRSIIDNVREGVITIDAKGRILSYNAAAEVIFGYSSDEVLGRNVSLLMPSPHREQHDGYLEAFMRTRRPKIIGVGRQVSGLRKSGAVFPMSLAVAEITAAAAASFIGLITDLSVEHEQEKLAHLATHDALTGLPNRVHFTAALDEALRDSQQEGCALLFIDIDRFKRINDELGHAAGDAALATVAGRLKHAVSHTDLVARLAGDEFVVLLRNVSGPAAAKAVAHRLVQAVAAPMAVGASSLNVGISVGVSVALPGRRSGAEVLAEADHAMYEAKRRGGHVVCGGAA